MKRIRVLAVLAPLNVLLVGCATAPISIDAIHSPLYRSTAHQSTIEATGEHSSGIQQIVLHITKGKATDCSEKGLPASVIPCRADAQTFTKTCSYIGSPTYTTCSHTENYGSQALVSYYAELVPVTGSTVKSTEITYSAGHPKDPKSKYKAPEARAVWWHRSVPSQSKIDFAFFPNKDYKGVYADFTSDLGKIAPMAFFNNKLQFGKLYYDYRHLFNLWAAPFGADESDVSPFGGTTGSILAVMDGSLILHNDATLRDWAIISQGGFGTTPSTSISGGGYQSAKTLIHESGHFLHGLGDEYCCDGGYITSGTCKNVFKTEKDCKSYVKAHGFTSAGGCVQIGKKSAWHLNHPGEIMGSSGKYNSSQRDWYECSRDCVVARFTKCVTGKCY